MKHNEDIMLLYVYAHKNFKVVINWYPSDTLIPYILDCLSNQGFVTHGKIKKYNHISSYVIETQTTLTNKGIKYIETMSHDKLLNLLYFKTDSNNLFGIPTSLVFKILWRRYRQYKLPATDMTFILTHDYPIEDLPFLNKFIKRIKASQK